MNDHELLHYGVIGMKWGVRRTPEQLGHNVAKSTKKAGDAFKNSVIQQTAQEVASTVTGTTKKGKKNGKKSASETAKTILKVAATAALTSILADAMKASVEDVGSMIFENGKQIAEEIIFEAANNGTTMGQAAQSISSIGDLLRLDGILK